MPAVRCGPLVRRIDACTGDAQDGLRKVGNAGIALREISDNLLRRTKQRLWQRRRVERFDNSFAASDTATPPVIASSVQNKTFDMVITNVMANANVRCRI